MVFFPLLRIRHKHTRNYCNFHLGKAHNRFNALAINVNALGSKPLDGPFAGGGSHGDGQSMFHSAAIKFPLIRCGNEYYRHCGNRFCKIASGIHQCRATQSIIFEPYFKLNYIFVLHSACKQYSYPAGQKRNCERTDKEGPERNSLRKILRKYDGDRKHRTACHEGSEHQRKPVFYKITKRFYRQCECKHQPCNKFCRKIQQPW